MSEYSTPLSIELPLTGNLTDDVVTNARVAPTSAVFARPSGGGWTDVTSAEFLAEVSALAKGLIAAGIEAGDRVALLSRTRYEWTLFDYAIWFAGAVTVPIYETSSVEQIAWILADSGAKAIVVETDEHAATVAESRTAAVLNSLGEVWQIEKGATAELTRRGAGTGDELLEQRRTSAGPGDVATIVYTSGTTGKPKGCMLTHGNFMYELTAAVEVELEELFHDNASTLLFLPLAHVFARIIQVGAIKSRARLGHTADIKSLVATLGTFQPTFVLAVPRVFEKVFNTAAQNAAADGKGKIFNRAADVAIAWSRAQDAGKVPFALRLQHGVFDKLVYTKLRAALGGRAEYAISGGAPLGERLGHFYRGVGLTILEGYGLTETTAALSVNTPRASRIGTVGRPFNGTSVKVAADGELLFRGGQVMAGYWDNESATAEILDADGWLHSGDVGEVDADGFIRVTGRKKEIIVTAAGKNVAPAVLEDRLRGHLLIDQCLVVGDGRPFIGALITLDAETVPTWAKLRGKSGTLVELAEDPDLVAEVERAVDEANKAVSRAESIRKYTVLTTSWTEEGGQLTASMKLKRNVVLRECRDEVDALYT